MASPGLLPKILEKIKSAQRPEKFSQDFLGTKLGFASGSAKASIPFLKKMGFLDESGSPTQRYSEFRNPVTSGRAIAEGMKELYSEIFSRNEFAQDLSKEQLTGLVTEITGSSHDDRTTKYTVSMFFNLLSLASFDDVDEDWRPAQQTEDFSRRTVSGQEITYGENAKEERSANESSAANTDLRLSYTINLNLPETTNPEVFNAIFKSLKEHLLDG
ncbi:hypothetical protein BWR17_04475 [Phaeobacter inhibens]|nr:hypothetical protein BWR17_04475 [Phaeobacter inhibens]